MPKINIQEIKNKIISIQNDLNKVLLDLDIALGAKMPDASLKARSEGLETEVGDVRVVEGVFDGQGMIGPDGKKYSIPANYASKSKLIEGDMLKLTIQGDGTFVFKQIGPIERDRLVGVLAFDEQEKQFFGVVDNKSYMLLTAAVTYYKGETGDEVILLVPEKGDSKWAAVENIVKKGPVSESTQKTILEEEVDEDGERLSSVQEELKQSTFEEDEFKII